MAKFSFKKVIAQMAAKTGIKCKNKPALFGPIKYTPLFQAKKAAILAKIAT